MRDRLDNLPLRRLVAPVGVAVVLALGAILGVVVGGGKRTSAPASTAGTGPPPPQVARDPVQAALASMSTQRKVAQLFVTSFDGQAPTKTLREQLRSGAPGGLLVRRANFAGPAQLRRLTRALRGGAARGRQIQPWVMARQEGGAFDDLPGLGPDSAPSDLRSTATAGRQALAAGRRLRRLGVNGVLGPSLDLGQADNPAVGGRAYSDQPREVAGFARAVAASYRRARVFSAPGHFPGLGGASQPTEEGPANVPSAAGELVKTDVVPFRRAIDAGVPGLQVSNGLYVYDDFVTPASLSGAVMTGLLRRRLGFRGVVVTGNLSEPGVTALTEPDRAAVQALRAGADLLLVAGPESDRRSAYRAVLDAVRRRRISPARLDEAVSRVLAVKRDYGLLR